MNRNLNTKLIQVKGSHYYHTGTLKYQDTSWSSKTWAPKITAAIILLCVIIILSDVNLLISGSTFEDIGLLTVTIVRPASELTNEELFNLAHSNLTKAMSKNNAVTQAIKSRQEAGDLSVPMSRQNTQDSTDQTAQADMAAVHVKGKLCLETPYDQVSGQDTTVKMLQIETKITKQTKEMVDTYAIKVSESGEILFPDTNMVAGTSGLSQSYSNPSVASENSLGSIASDPFSDKHKVAGTSGLSQSYSNPSVASENSLGSTASDPFSDKNPVVGAGTSGLSQSYSNPSVASGNSADSATPIVKSSDIPMSSENKGKGPYLGSSPLEDIWVPAGILQLFEVMNPIIIITGAVIFITVSATYIIARVVNPGYAFSMLLYFSGKPWLLQLVIHWLKIVLRSV